MLRLSQLILKKIGSSPAQEATQQLEKACDKLKANKAGNLKSTELNAKLKVGIELTK